MRFTITSAILVLASTGWALAQEKPQPPSESAQEKQEKKDNDTASREEHVIYVPYKNLKDIFEKEESSVLLPYAQFLQMWGQMIGPIVPPVKPPVTGVITRADYAGAVEDELVRLWATLTVEVLDKEWARLPVQFGEAAVGEARSEDGAVLLRGVGSGSYELLVSGRGKHMVSFELVAHVKSSPDGKSFSLNCPPVGVSNLELSIPEQDLAVQVTPRRTSQLVPGEKGATKVRAVLGSTDQFAVAWQPKSGAAAEMAGLASVSDAIEVVVGDGVVHTYSVFQYTVLRGSLDSLVLLLPADQRPLDVQVPGLRDWQSEMIDGQQRLSVRLHAPVRDKLRLEVRSESPIPEKEFQVAQIRAAGVARESGTIGLRGAEDVGLEIVAHESLTRIDAAEAPESLRKPQSTFYKFFNPDFRLSVVASALEPRVSVDSFLTVMADKSRVSLRGDFKYSVSRAGIFSVRLRLPTGFNVDEVQCDAMERHETATEGDTPVLIVFLSKKIVGDLHIAVLLSQPHGMVAGDLELPLIEPLGVPREQGLVAVIVPESLELSSDPAKLESARPATPVELAARGFSPQPPAGSTIAAAFAFSRRPVRIPLAVTARPRRVLATVATVATVKEEVVKVTTTIQYQVQYAGTDTFRFAVPGSVAGQVQIEGNGIKEKRRTDNPEEDGSVVWTILLHSEAVGDRAFSVTYDQNISVPERGAVPFKLEPVRVLDADRETGEIAILKDRSLAIEPTKEGLEEIDPRELTRPLDKEQPYLTYRYFRHPAQLTLAITKHELQDVVKTVVSRAYVEAVVSREGPITMRARYLVKSSERQRLAITLPATRVLGITVAGRSVPPEKAPAAPGGAASDKSYFINIARQTDIDQAFPIAIVFEAVAPPGGKLATTDQLRLSLPRFEQGVKFQQLYVRVWLPEQYRAVGEPQGFSNETRYAADLLGFRLVNFALEDPDAWFSGEAATFDFRTAGRAYLYSSLSDPSELAMSYWHLPSMTLAGSLAALMIGVVLVFFRLETKVLLVMAATLALLLSGLFWPESVKSWLAAARIGIAGMVALWLVVFILRMRRAMPLSLALPGMGSIPMSSANPSSAADQPPPTAPKADRPASDQGQEGGQA